jgi:hypothetical protein
MGLAVVGGCFSRPTEPVKKTEGGSNFDRLNQVRGAGHPNPKGKGPAKSTAASKTTTGAGEKEPKGD